MKNLKTGFHQFKKSFIWIQLVFLSRNPLKDILVQIWLQLGRMYKSEFPVSMYLAIENILQVGLQYQHQKCYRNCILNKNNENLDILRRITKLNVVHIKKIKKKSLKQPKINTKKKKTQQKILNTVTVFFKKKPVQDTTMYFQAKLSILRECRCSCQKENLL